MRIVNSVKRFFINRRFDKSIYSSFDDKYNFRRTNDVGGKVPKKSSGGSSIVVGLAKRLGFRFGDLTSKDFDEPEYDLMDIDSAYDADTYVRQAVDKYIEQIFKEGHKLSGKNPNTVEYIKTRFAFMAETTQMPMEQFFTEIAEDIVKYSNCIIAKSRLADPSQLPQGVTVAGIDGAEPIAGYFLLHPGTMKVKRDKNGTIKGWQQEVDGGDKPQKFKPEDIVHMYYKRKKGNAFGTPFLHPVLDDLQALRFLEENCLNMLYKHINPLIHIAVGDKESSGTDKEINDVKRDMEGMEAGGGIVTTNRVIMNAVQTNSSIDASPYLSYLENRVFSGLGVPAVKFGRGGTANRNTADSMTDEMSDRIKAIQTCIMQHINFFLIKELLQEGGFDPLNNPDDMVFFEFIENDLDRKIKAETHACYLFEHKAIDENEMREEIGREPITDRALMFDSLYGGEVGNGQGGTGAKKSGETDNKQKPTNQSGTKTSPKKTTNEFSNEREVLEKILLGDKKYMTKEFNLSDFDMDIILNVFKKSLNYKHFDNSIYCENCYERIIRMIDTLKNVKKRRE